MIHFDGLYKVLRVVDGDGFIGAHFISNEVVEFRLLGIDAPEIKVCKKLKQDEKELHLPGSLLIELGSIAAAYFRSAVPVDTLVHIKQESRNMADKYGRKLCYAYRQDGSCINELLVAEGYAKPYCNVYCNQLPTYQLLNTFAKQQSKGLYSIVEKF
ncbi:thermonuclease family protein [Aridibaculum aurantiacum]|uniref:thermonuclease family protein n=1 Tax=Aridibaculum aurantiacum TaxID=2810307 RepID=UPI001A95E3F7|nr:thermonuclease family protein [Aridibaculum aurantiacum]